MIRIAIIGSCVFSISFEGSIITFFEAIIGCPGMFSEHLMPPRGVEPWLELLMQIDVQPVICINFFSDAKLVMTQEKYVGQKYSLKNKYFFSSFNNDRGLSLEDKTKDYVDRNTGQV